MSSITAGSVAATAQASVSEDVMKLFHEKSNAKLGEAQVILISHYFYRNSVDGVSPTIALAQKIADMNSDKKIIFAIPDEEAGKFASFLEGKDFWIWIESKQLEEYVKAFEKVTKDEDNEKQDTTKRENTAWGPQRKMLVNFIADDIKKYVASNVFVILVDFFVLNPLIPSQKILINQVEKALEKYKYVQFTPNLESNDKKEEGKE